MTVKVNTFKETSQQATKAPARAIYDYEGTKDGERRSVRVHAYCRDSALEVMRKNGWTGPFELFGFEIVPDDYCVQCWKAPAYATDFLAGKKTLCHGCFASYMDRQGSE